MTVRLRWTLVPLVLASVLGGVLGVAGCSGPTGAAPSSVGPSSPTSAPEDGGATSVHRVPADAAEARAEGAALGVGDVVAVLLWPEAAPSEADGGVRELRFDVGPGALRTEDGATVESDALLLAAPEGGDVTVHDDGSALVTGDDGLGRAVLVPPRTSGGVRARWERVDDGLVALRVRPDPLAPEDEAGSVRAAVAEGALTSATWGEREGGSSVAVVPAPWARTPSEATTALLWDELVAAEPDADAPGMRDQLVCHTIGAPDKETWNLEPWRPDVGLVAVLAARCNPT